jgi:hypothetical protein
MRKCLAVILAFAAALLAFLPGASEAGLNLNHNETLLAD